MLARFPQHGGCAADGLSLQHRLDQVVADTGRTTSRRCSCHALPRLSGLRGTLPAGRSSSSVRRRRSTPAKRPADSTLIALIHQYRRIRHDTDRRQISAQPARDESFNYSPTRGRTVRAPPHKLSDLYGDSHQPIVTSEGTERSLFGVADHGGGDERADAEEAGQAGARCLDRDGEFLLRLADLGVQAALSSRSSAARSKQACLPGGAGWRAAVQDAGGLGRGDFVGHTAGGPARRARRGAGTRPGPAQVPVPPGPDLQHRAVVIGGHQPPGLGGWCSPTSPRTPTETSARAAGRSTLHTYASDARTGTPASAAFRALSCGVLGVRG